MSITRDALKQLRVFAVKCATGTGVTGNAVRRRSVFMLAASLAALALQPAIASQVQDLSGVVDQIGGDSEGVTTLADKYRLTNAGRCALLVAGTSSSNSVPIYFIPGPLPVAALQADVIVGPGITISDISAGPETLAVRKDVQSAPISGGQRFILFGLNTNSLITGNAANVSLNLTGASIGPHIIALTNFVASSASGNDVPLCVTTGVINK